MERVFIDDVLCNYDTYLQNVNYPLLVILAGQPGSGKSTAARRTIPALHGLDGSKILRIDIDTFRKYHPAYDDICHYDIIGMEKHTGSFAYYCRKRLLQEGMKAGVPIVLENSIANPEMIINLAKEFKLAGYSVELHAMAVPSKTSAFGIFNRFMLDEAQAQYTGRWVDLGVHNQAYANLPQNMETVLASGLVNRIGIHNRAGQLFDLILGSRKPVAVGSSARLLERYRTAREPSEAHQLHLDNWRGLMQVINDTPHTPTLIIEAAPPYVLEARLSTQAVFAVSADNLQGGVVRAITPHLIFVEMDRGLVAFRRSPAIKPNIYAGEEWHPKTGKLRYPERPKGRARPSGRYDF